MKSYKTFISALITLLGVLLATVSLAFDDDPKTLVDITGVLKAIATFLISTGVLGNGWYARDDEVSDEQAGAGVEKKTIVMTMEDHKKYEEFLRTRSEA